MAQDLTEDQLQKIIDHCNLIYVIHKHYEAPITISVKDRNNNRKSSKSSKKSRKVDDEDVKTLQRILFLLSATAREQNSKAMSVTLATAAYLCCHPSIPIALVEILRDCTRLRICSLILDILVKLVMRNAVVPEADCKCIRKQFYDAGNFKIAVLAFKNLHEHQDAQVRMLKVLNCLYSRKGQSQLAHISDEMVEFVGCHFVAHSAHRDIVRCMLPLIKTLCRNKKFCSLICRESFLTAFIDVVPAVKKYPAGISILRFMSRHPPSMLELSRHEMVYAFIVDAAVYHADKSTNRKYLIGALLRLSKTPDGCSFMRNETLWRQLMHFFMRSERLDEVRQRLSFTRAYAVLHRGVCVRRARATPVGVDFGFSRQIQQYIHRKANHCCDDSDNDESDNDEQDEDKDGGREQRSRTSSDERNGDEDDDEDDVDRGSVEEGAEEEDDEEEDYHADDSSKLDTSSSRFFQEFASLLEPLEPKCFIESVKRHAVYNRLALPDALMVEDFVEDHQPIITSDINIYSVGEMVLKASRGREELTQGTTHFRRVTVYDLDALIASDSHNAYIPRIEELSDIEDCNTDSDQPLKFESRFESGNLRTAIQIDTNEYDLILAPDVNVSSGLQWFYCQVAGMRPHVTYTLNIVNCQKANSQFCYGMQPVMFSAKAYRAEGAGWRRMGAAVMYYGNEYQPDVDGDAGESGVRMRTLRFSFEVEHSGDYCYFAYCYPYTYSRLMVELNSLLNVSYADIYYRIDNLSTTLGGFNVVPLVTITAKSNSIPIQDRRVVFLTSRVHPGESNASWIIEGVLRHLLTENESARRARERYVFKIVPMLNPEGVIYGNTRCGLSGDDLNRRWKQPHPMLHPEIYSAKQLVHYAKSHLPNEVYAFIDVHGHSRKKFCFLYGCDAMLSWSDDDRMAAMEQESACDMLSKAFSHHSEHFKATYCRNTIERKRETTCRVVMWREFDIQRSHTLECSFCAGNGKRKMSTSMLRDIGVSLIDAFAELVE